MVTSRRNRRVPNENWQGKRIRGKVIGTKERRAACTAVERGEKQM